MDDDEVNVDTTDPTVSGTALSPAVDDTAGQDLEFGLSFPDGDVDIDTTDATVSGPELSPADDDAEGRNLEFELFYRADMLRLVAFLVVQGAPPTLAADLAQDAMVNVYRSWDDVDAPRAFVRTTATRAWWRWAEREKRQIPHGEVPEPAWLLYPDESAEIENRHAFLRAIRALPKEQREVMAWTYDGYRPTEIAAIIQKHPATVRSLLRKAREALRKADAGEGS